MISWLRAWLDRLLRRRQRPFGPPPTTEQMVGLFDEARVFGDIVSREYPAGSWYGTHAKRMPPRWVED